MCNRYGRMVEINNHGYMWILNECPLAFPDHHSEFTTFGGYIMFRRFDIMVTLSSVHTRDNDSTRVVH